MSNEGSPPDSVSDSLAKRSTGAQPHMSQNQFEHVTITGGGHARIHLGNAYHIFEHGSDEERKAALLDALYYDRMEARQNHLDSDELISPSSFKWVWSTPVQTWLQQSDSIFWICGKPGSGKSTLMNYLAKSQRTIETLNKVGSNWIVISFFFDYRAAAGIANQKNGMLRSFLYQLIQSLPNHGQHSTRSNIQTLSKEMDENLLKRAMCNVVKNAKAKVCAFVDGLDEYEGDLVGLINSIRSLSDQTGMRFCLASRPEPVLQMVLGDCLTIRMQEHNQQGLEICIERAILQERQKNLDVDSTFTSELRSEILLKAEGVILWARLVVDILLKNYRRDASLKNLRELLKGLPPEIEEIYERIVSRIASSYQDEAAINLKLISESKGIILLNTLHSIWPFIIETIPGLNMRRDLSEAELKLRIAATLGSLIDIVPIRSYIPTSEGHFLGYEIRHTHQTLGVFLERSSWMSSSLPEAFIRCYPDRVMLRLWAKIVETAKNECVIYQNQILEWFANNSLTTYHRDFDDVSFSPGFIKFRQWPHVPLLKRAVFNLLILAESDESEGMSSYDIILDAIHADVMLLDYCWQLIVTSRKSYILHRIRNIYRNGVPIYMALTIFYTLTSSFREFLHNDWERMEQCKNALLEIALIRYFSCYDFDPRKSRAAQIVAELVAKGAQFGSSQLCLLLSDSNLLQFFDKDVVLLEELITSRPKKSWPTRHHEACSLQMKNSGMLYHWATNYGLLAVNDEAVLDFLLNSGEDINSNCYPGGTVLHATLDELPRCGKDRLGILLKKFVIAAHAGASPKVTGCEGTVLEVACKQQKRSMLRKFGNRLRIPIEADGLTREEQRNVAKVQAKTIEWIEYYEKHRSWPDDLII